MPRHNCRFYRGQTTSYNIEDVIGQFNGTGLHQFVIDVLCFIQFLFELLLQLLNLLL